MFLAATIGAQSWLRDQGQRLRAESVEAKRVQFDALLQVMNRPVDDWDDAYRRQLGDMIGGIVTLQDEGAALPRRDTAWLYIERSSKPIGGVSRIIRVAFPAPSTSRLMAMYQQVTVGLLLFGVALLITGAFFAVLNPRSVEGDTATPTTLRDTRATMGSLEHLARTSVAQGAELHMERDSRRLAEEDALLKQQLLNQSLEGKIRLGNDLHDGIIQSLYASGLTMESPRTLARTNPAEADRALEQCLQNLNVLIRDVRSYITGLAPESLRRAGFADAIEAHITELGAGRALKFDLKFDDEAIARLTPEQTTEALQVAREAISNSLRHGGASFVTVRLHQSDREIGLLVQDNGIGFTPDQQESSGHGLRNMQKRAARIGASVRVESQPGNGTRVVLTLPLFSPTV